MGGMPAFMLLSRSFQIAKPFQRASRAVGDGTNATRRFVDTISIIAICFHPNPVVGFDNV
jgi:hypothetical protein